MRSVGTLVCAAFAFSASAQVLSSFELSFNAPGPVGTARYVDGAVAPDGSIALLSEDDAGITSQFVLTRTGADGTVAWCREFATTAPGQMLEARKTVFLATGDILCFGLLFAQSGNNYFLARVSPSGDLLWSHSYELTTNYYGDYGGSSLQALTGGGAIVSMGMLQRTVAMRVADDGSVIWARSYVTTQVPTNKNPGFDFALLPDGGALFTEKAENDIFLVRTDPDGEVLWSLRYPNGMYNHPNVAIAIDDGGFLIAGSADVQPMAMRLDSYGNLVWAKRFHFDECSVEGFQQAVQLSDGSFLLTPSRNSMGLLGFHVGALGTPLEATALWGEQSYADIIGLHDGAAILAGSVVTTDPQGNNSTIIPLLRMGASMSMACGGLYTWASAENIVSPSEPTSGCYMQDEPINVQEFYLEVDPRIASATPLCAAITGIPEVAAPLAFSASPTLVEAGGDVSLAWTGPSAIGRLRSFSSDGREEFVHALDGVQRLVLNTAGWTPGVHLLLACDPTGAATGTARVVVH